MGTPSAAQDVVLTNDGSEPLTVTSVALENADRGDFEISDNTCSGAIAPNGRCTLWIYFKPTARGSRSASLTIAHNAGGGRLQVPLSGTGTQKLPFSAIIAGSLLIITACYSLYLWRSRKIPQDKPPPWNPDLPRHFRLGTNGNKPAPRLDASTLDRLADSLGYFQSEQSSKWLDLSASIEATGRNGGIPALVYHRRKQIRTVLILEDAFAEALALDT